MHIPARSVGRFCVLLFCVTAAVSAGSAAVSAKPAAPAAGTGSPPRGAKTPGAVRIVVSKAAPSLEKLAADDLAHGLRQLWPSVRFEVGAQEGESGRAVILGSLRSDPALRPYVDAGALATPESYVVKVSKQGGGETAVIIGADPRGAAYGVYALLEKLGCGFYLSCDTFPPARREPFSFEGWELADAPLVRDRMVFDWHNFLSGCSTWNLPDWQKWIAQSQKMGYNGVMVHAYGNNPMVSFTFNGKDKPLGYLSTTRKGRDWSTQHVNDVRRLWGGFVFGQPVFGPDAAMVPDDERGAAAQRLMHDVFAYAKERDMNVFLAVDVDTLSANPQELIETLPPDTRFAIATAPARGAKPAAGKLWLANPDTPEGYRYYKAQVAALLKAYPQIHSLVVWWRTGATPWTALELDELPPRWQEEFRRELAKTPSAEKLWQSHNQFALGKIVLAFERALKELGRGDVEIAAGSWNFDFLPAADRFLPRHVKFIPLDWQVLNDRSQLRDAESRRVIRNVAEHRPVVPVVWAHHDDGNYVGRPYTPYSDFHTRLAECNAAGYGIIHWMTRPLDLYFKSLAKQVWRVTENQPLRQTCDEMAARLFGGAARKAMGEYLFRWVNDAPKFARETSDFFIDRPMKDVEQTRAGCRDRLNLIAQVEVSELAPEQRDRVNYFKGLEEFILAVYRTQTGFEHAQELLKQSDLAAASKELAACHPGEVIEQFARFASLGGITRGEQGLVASMNLRWLTHYVRLRQLLGMEAIRYCFGPTSHDPLAQSMGTFTFYFEPNRDVWERLGTRETGAPTFVLAKGANLTRGEDVPEAYEELCRAGIESDKPITLALQPIMAKGGRGADQTPPLPIGRYRLSLLLADPTSTAPNQRVFDVSVGPATSSAALSSDRVDVFKQSGGARRVLVLSYPVDLAHAGRIAVTLTPVRGKVVLSGAILEPVSTVAKP